MQNNINNNERDAFSDIFRQKLENHQIPVNAAIWDEIEERLKSKKRRIIPLFWLWISGGAAVAVVALLFTIHPLNETKNLIGKSTPTIIQQRPVQSKQIAKLQQQKTIQTEEATTKQVSATNPTTVIPAEEIYSTDLHLIKTIANDTTSSKNTIGNVTGNDLGDGTEITQKTSGEKDSISTDLRELSNNLIEKPLNKPTTRTKNKNSWLLAAAVGSNSSVQASDNSNYKPLEEEHSFITGSEIVKHTGIMKLKEFSNINYNPPISFGLIIRKNLDTEFSLESGLVYTYLLTTFENNSTQQNNARLHLHYIGVPLNLIARLWNNTKWEIYLSGGGMLEKGIRSAYVQNQYGGSQIITTTAITNIQGVQWSVNGAVGATYKLSNDLGIFFEPKTSYYFKDKQPISARTKYPVVIGVTAGVRFIFK